MDDKEIMAEFKELRNIVNAFRNWVASQDIKPAEVGPALALAAGLEIADILKKRDCAPYIKEAQRLGALQMLVNIMSVASEGQI